MASRHQREPVPQSFGHEFCRLRTVRGSHGRALIIRWNLQCWRCSAKLLAPEVELRDEVARIVPSTLRNCVVTVLSRQLRKVRGHTAHQRRVALREFPHEDAR